jgi:ectoine hydroxylase
MRLAPDQLDQFDRDGFLILPELFTAEEVGVLRAELDTLFAEDCPQNIRERVSGEIRTAMGLHLRNAVYARMVRHPRLLLPAMQILGDDHLYIQQVKVNAKVAYSGEVWQWHYDFATHHNEDGVPKPLALNLHVLIDDVTEFNGPLWFIPGSHKGGPVPAALDTSTNYPLWCVDNDTVAGLATERGIVSAKGRAGTALIFGDCLLHGSPPNMSPWNRRIYSLIVNPISNAYTKETRADHQHHRSLSPVAPLDDNCLLSATAA